MMCCRCKISVFAGYKVSSDTRASSFRSHTASVVYKMMFWTPCVLFLKWKVGSSSSNDDEKAALANFSNIVCVPTN
jgi:hypothetical protein